MATVAKIEPVLAKDVKLLKSVDYGTYHVVLQIGARNRWRAFGGGKWERDIENDDPQSKLEAYKHVPAIHEVDMLPSKIVNGLISKHNSWVEANRKNVLPKGDVSRQILVLKITRLSDVEKANEAEIRIERMVEKKIQEILQQKDKS